MRAVGYRTPGDIDAPEALLDIDLPRPEPGPRDLLVEVRAVSVNPVDTKVRLRAAADPGGWKVLGWDAAGVVVDVGAEVSRFKSGDEVFYAGALNRPGTNAEYHAVDARIVGRKPSSLDFAQAAALPLTAITAWETLFDRLDVRRTVPGAAAAVLVIGGAGGVGSIAIQLARQLTDLMVIATASRPETVAWVRGLGADHVVDHRDRWTPKSRPSASARQPSSSRPRPPIATWRPWPSSSRRRADGRSSTTRVWSTSRRSSARACRHTGSSCSPARYSRPPIWTHRAGCSTRCRASSTQAC